MSYPLSELDVTHPPSVIINLGGGVDSVALTLRYLVEPSSRDFEWDDAVVIMAMTGDEFDSTGRDIEDHLLPLLRESRVRFVQVARGQRHVTVAGDGVVVLDDSRSPERVHLAGAYKLSDEMLQAGTVPQRGGARLCSVHSKGDALDPAIARLTQGHPFRQVIGFEAGEPKRAVKDAKYNTDLRTGAYPLIEWGWDRAACVAFILDVTGIVWEKSACKACPFAMSNKAGLARILTRYADDPPAGVDTLFMEHVALTLNPNQTLVSGRSARAVVVEAGLIEVLDQLEDRLASTGHAVYEVRRILRPRTDDPQKMVNASRSVARVATGSRAAMAHELDRLAGTHPGGVEVDSHGIGRVHVRRRGAHLPTTEHFYVNAPDVVHDKQSAGFETWWSALVPAPAETARTAP